MCGQRDSMRMVRDAACLLNQVLRGPVDPVLEPMLAYYDRIVCEPIPEAFGQIMDRLE